ncbi:MAG: glycoside hydrolase family 38 C-terminal domain-containing protein [Armatimonadota bacterium]|nr:glycoside hydrolase family 38 C-terminal domain-containing protein [Armatimonadota bacterium]
MSYTMHVVSHTHWDREWYLTFQQFRIRLVDLIVHLLHILDTDPDFKHFNLDGQTIILEDYLQIRPQDEEKLRRYIQEGRILIGPWYQLNDEFLVSGESTIRNLLIGHRIASKFGNIMKVGYLPDQFGNVSQMPQILQEFGIKSCIFGRGLQLTDGRKMEFIWESPDGSQVLASLMAFWYNNAQRFPSDTEEAVEYTKRIRDMMAPHATTSQLLLMNGVDHLEPQEGLSKIIQRVNEQLKEDKLVHSTLPAYIEAVQRDIEKNKLELQVIRGELREDRGESVLAGTLSSRIYLKQANNECEIWLEKYAEPLSSFAWMIGNEYPSDFLCYTWKLLMQNHPHDSICGCSIDQVHNEMMARFAQVQQIAQELTNRSLEYLASAINTLHESLVVFNPLSWPRTDRVTATIEFPLGEPVRGEPTIDYSKDVKAIEILDPHGKRIPYKLLERSIAAKQVLSPIELPRSVMVRRFLVEFIAENVPACGYKTYSINPVPRIPKFENCLTNQLYWEGVLSNETIAVNIFEGAITLLDKQAEAGEAEDGLVYSSLGILEDGGDVGDEYHYRQPTKDCKITTLQSAPKVSIEDNSPISATFRLDMTLKLPKSAQPNERERSEEVVDCPVTTWITVSAKSPRVDIITEFENQAKDHRLRVLFPSGIETNVSHAEGQFDVITRPIRPPKEWHDAAPFYPQRWWVDVNDGEKGLTIINKGLPEYEVYDDEARTIALTLLRCVGRLSGSGETPTAIPTPGAQCLGKHRFEYAILPHKGTWEDAMVWRQAHQFNVKMLAIQTGVHKGKLPAEHSFIEVDAPSLVITAIKKAEDRDSLIVRFFNISEQNAHNVKIRVDKAISARTVNLNEEPGTELTMESDGSVILDVPGRKIATLEFNLEK